MLLAACALLLAGTAPAGAVRPSAAARADRGRFGLDRSSEPARRLPTARDLAALREFRRVHGSGVRLLYHPRTGAPQILRGFSASPKARDPETAARLFLDDSVDVLKVRSADLRLALKRGDGHLLFQQVHQGVPVEGGRVGVHLDRAGRIRYVHSEFDPEIAASPVPSLGEAAARDAVGRDLGRSVRAPGTLVYLPERPGGALRLAWKFRFGASDAKWVYYVDAGDGRVLLRYDDRRYQTFVTSGTLSGGAFPLSPFSSCDGSPSRVPFKGAHVWIVDSGSQAVTDAGGFYSFGLQGRIWTTLSGTHVVVSHEKGPNASYDNGAGQWFPFSTPLASPHPYSAKADLSATITAPSEALRLRAHFSSFEVGSEPTQTEGDFDDDQVRIQDGSGGRVAFYFGKLSPFLSADVPGRTLTLRLVSNESLQGNGYEVDVSSYFKFTEDPTSSATLRSSYDLYWSSANAFDGRWDEMNVFYQVNAMHDYFSRLSGTDTPLDLAYAMPATVHHSVGFNNASYDPDNKDMYFGDGFLGGCLTPCGNQMDCSFALDTSVVRHEYGHFAMDRIYPILNFGEFGAISEGVADYFALSSLNYPKIGEFINKGVIPLRSLDDGIGSGSDPNLVCSGACARLPGSWAGEIHEDSLVLSQALWSIRQVAGAPRADAVVFRTLFFFPGSFREFREALLQADSDLYPGDPGSKHAFLERAFTVHGISGTVTGEDVNEPNDAPQTATDLSAGGAISGSVYPVADLDYFAFPAAAGSVSVSLALPQRIPGEYLALGLSVSDARNQVLATASSRPENATAAGNCPDTGDCWTGDSALNLTVANPRAGTLYIGVHCGSNDFGSIGGCQSSVPYSLRVSQALEQASAGSGMTATRSGEELAFTLPMTMYVNGSSAVWNYAAARLRDHNLAVLDETDTRGGAVRLSVVGPPAISSNVMTGRFGLHPGTAARYPAVGTVYLEILGNNAFGSIQSIGISQAIGLNATGAGSFTAWNNVMNPTKGEKATLRVSVSGTGRTRLRLFTLHGRLVKTLLDRDVTGSASVDWDGKNENGNTVASGVYLAHVDGPGIRKTQKVVVVK